MVINLISIYNILCLKLKMTKNTIQIGVLFLFVFELSTPPSYNANRPHTLFVPRKKQKKPPLGEHTIERSATFLDLFDIIPHGIVPYLSDPLFFVE